MPKSIKIVSSRGCFWTGFLSYNCTVQAINRFVVIAACNDKLVVSGNPNIDFHTHDGTWIKSSDWRGKHVGTDIVCLEEGRNRVFWNVTDEVLGERERDAVNGLFVFVGRNSCDQLFSR